MEERASKAVGEFRKDPEAASKKTEEAIKWMGVKLDKKLVEKLAAQVVAYRQMTDRRAGNPRELVSCMTRARRTRCVQWWKSTSPSTKGKASYEKCRL
jgi:hypothetical protein